MGLFLGANAINNSHNHKILANSDCACEISKQDNHNIDLDDHTDNSHEGKLLTDPGMGFLSHINYVIIIF